MYNNLFMENNLQLNIEEMDYPIINESAINEDVFLDNYAEYDEYVCNNRSNYTLNYTVKQMLLICNYYNLSKNHKLNKLKKEDLANLLISFESDKDNSEIVNMRLTCWFFMNELKKDKFMKKYIVW
jgi:hypothetical protein